MAKMNKVLNKRAEPEANRRVLFHCFHMWLIEFHRINSFFKGKNGAVAKRATQMT